MRLIPKKQEQWLVSLLECPFYQDRPAPLVPRQCEILLLFWRMDSHAADSVWILIEVRSRSRLSYRN